MRETPLSTCERDFILSVIADRKRIDGRQTYDYRKIKIVFGIDRGCCSVELGKTRVLAQVSCEVTEPQQTRPTDGILFMNVELSPMACPSFESGRLSDEGVELNRLLERCIKESRCLDTESLCIVAGQKVWTIRIDIHVLNQEGNILDCASIAAITALVHFRRPDVTVSGEDVTIHDLDDRDPVPLSVHHMPICVSFAFFDQGKFLLVDPENGEEKVMDGKMVIGMNKHREICTLQITGDMLLLKEQVLRCSNIAVVKVQEISELIQTALENDKTARSEGRKYGFAESIEREQVTTHHTDITNVDMEDITQTKDETMVEEDNQEQENSEENKVTILEKGTGIVGEGGRNSWLISDDDEDVKIEPSIPNKSKKHKQKEKKEAYSFGDDSEEEETVVLDESDLHMIKKVPGSSDSVDLQSLKPSKSTPGKKKKKR
ncbi:exosome complex component RRP45 [Patella vulgata]|uniref:exosome complex component RRP45 n=1 Tax=Patella vulgata TaxID=6465 RepID=UPI00217F2FBD|nr:exosome complex component RRP45 [Patella vulgata]